MDQPTLIPVKVSVAQTYFYLKTSFEPLGIDPAVVLNYILEDVFMTQLNEDIGNKIVHYVRLKISESFLSEEALHEIIHRAYEFAVDDVTAHITHLKAGTNADHAFSYGRGTDIMVYVPSAKYDPQGTHRAIYVPQAAVDIAVRKPSVSI
jgi:hypothetical protein